MAKTLAESLQKPKDSTELQKKLSLNTKPESKPMNAQTARQLSDLLTQSFEIFNVYGKEPDAVKTMLHGFSQVLSGFSAEHITKAFQQWMEESAVMPTPANIRKICADIAASEQKRPGEVRWTQVIRSRATLEIVAEYHQGHHLGPMDIEKKHPECLVGMRRESESPSETIPEVPLAKVVPWAGLMHHQFTPELFDQLAQHLGEMPIAKANDYRSYLRSHCGFPKGEE